MNRGETAIASVLLTAFVTGCPGPPESETPAQPEGASSPAAPAPLFSNAAEEAALDFVHFNGATDDYFFPEIMGGGVALFDYDNDGDLDAYFVQSGRINATTPLRVIDARTRWDNRLYENRIVPDGRLSFVDVSEETGAADRGYGMGAAVADVDGDGDQDLYVTNVGEDVLFLNTGRGTFERMPAAVSSAVDGWSTSASFLDYNGDSAVDLFVARYVMVNLEKGRVCIGRPTIKQDYCSPTRFPQLEDRLLTGDGRGGFEQRDSWHAAQSAGSSGLGVAVGDYDGDGWTDIYVANDQRPNQLWINRRDGTFEELALMSGSAYNADGMPEASMGVTSADVDADGDLDLFMTHLRNETNTLYVNDGEGNFSDSTNQFNLGATSLAATGFGTRWFDADNDGDLDLFCANGGVIVDTDALGKSYNAAYSQPNQLFLNLGEGRFEDATADIPDIGRAAISRGAAFGDVDNDGDIDILVGNINGRPDLLLASAPDENNWLSVRLKTGGGNRDGLGASIGVERPAKPVLWRQVTTDGSYLSASDVRVHFGLGPGVSTVDVRVRWPGGATERFEGISTDQFAILKRGEGTDVVR